MTGFNRWLGVLLALPGMAAIVPPFCYGVSPMTVLREVGGQASRTFAADYPPNAILCLVAFAMPDGPGGWQVGAWVTLVACVCSIIQIALVMRTR